MTPAIMDRAAGAAGRDAGIAQAEAAANEKWREAARAAAARVCHQKHLFSVDDVWEEMHAVEGVEFAEFGTHELRAMGAVLKWAEKEGLCENTKTFIGSSRKTCHRNPRSLWRSRIKAKKEAAP